MWRFLKTTGQPYGGPKGIRLGSTSPHPKTKPMCPLSVGLAHKIPRQGCSKVGPRRRSAGNDRCDGMGEAAGRALGPPGYQGRKI